ncbi:putative Protein HGH1-like protein [Nannochloris sp. 'desiccata']|nr:putative Protein HGH1-like protein [Chlorella desiccata (nom. nud.)]
MDDLGDLIGFLSEIRLDVKQHAVELVQGLTGSPEGIAQLATRTDALLPPLFRLVGAAQPAISRPALSSLVNLSQEPAAQKKLLELNAPARCMDYLKENTCRGQEDLLIMLLANLTAAEEGAAALMQLGKTGLEGLNLAILLRLFLDTTNIKAGEDPFEHVATILPNVTRFKEGRQVLLEPGRGALTALASQLRSKSELRRRGCSGAIKNCCFTCEEDGTVEDIGEESSALADILGVLAGIPEIEKDDIVRENLAEAVLCLAKVPDARKKLWAADAPELLKKGYEFEEHPGVCEAMEGAAQFFLEDGLQKDDDGEGENIEERGEKEGTKEKRPDVGGGEGEQFIGRPDVQIEELD